MMNLRIALEHDHEFRGDEEPIQYPADEIASAELEITEGFNFDVMPLVKAMESERPYSRRYRQIATESVMEDQGFWALLLVAIGLALVAVSKMLDWFSGGSKGGKGGGGGFSISSPIIRFETKVIRMSDLLGNGSKAFSLLLGGDSKAEVSQVIKDDKLFAKMYERLFSNFTELQREFPDYSGDLIGALDKAIASATLKGNGRRIMRDATVTKLGHTWTEAFENIDRNGWRGAGFDWTRVAEGAQSVLTDQEKIDEDGTIQAFLELRSQLADKPAKLSESEATKWLGKFFDETDSNVVDHMKTTIDKFKEAIAAVTSLRDQVEKTQKGLEAGFSKHPIDIKDLSKSTASKEKNLAGISEADAEGWENQTREDYNEAQRLTKSAFQITLGAMRKELNFMSAVIHFFNQRIDFYERAEAALMELAKSVKSSMKTAGTEVPVEVDDAIKLLSKKA